MNDYSCKLDIDIIANGIFTLNQINCIHNKKNIPFSEEENSFIQEEWEKTIIEKPFLFNGKLFHLQNYLTQDFKITLRMCTSHFKELVGTQSLTFRSKFSLKKCLRPLSVGTIIITSDNKWIIGKRLKTHNYEGFYTFIAGYMDPSKDISNTKPNPFYTMKRELKEETGITNTNIENMICTGFIDKEKPHLTFLTTLNISYEQICNLDPQDKEFIKLEGYELLENKINDFLTLHYNKITPHTITNLLIYRNLFRSCLS